MVSCLDKQKKNEKITSAITKKKSTNSKIVSSTAAVTPSAPIQIHGLNKELNISSQINKIVINSPNFKPSNTVSIDTNNVPSTNVFPIVSSSPSSALNTTTLPSSLLTTATNLAIGTNSNQSYQLLFTTVSKSHPRIKYSGLKKCDDKPPLIVEAVVPTIAANSANILDISAIAPIMTTPMTPLTPLTTTITIPAQALPLQTLHKSSSQIINFSGSDLSPTIKYADIDDIELPDGTKIGYPTDLTEIKRMQQQQQQQSQDTSNDTSYTANLAEKYSILAATALKNFDFTINDSTLNQSNGSTITNNDSVNESGPMAIGDEDGGEELFACRHCGKKYRWKSTLRRHENDECGNKEPAHQCPYCPYKAKQRGNLGVHVRKHHANMPQLESRRKRKN